MAGKQVTGDGLAGMSKNQLYDIMCQMKTLIDKNQQQARQILIQNPSSTKALFQAQIILGMVQPPQSTPSIQPTSSQQPSSSLIEQQRTQGASSLPAQISLQEETRKQQLSKAGTPASSATLPAVKVELPAFTSHPLQPVNQARGTTQMPPSAQSSQILPHPLPHHSTPQPPVHHHAPMVLGSNQMQHPTQSSNIMQMNPRQPPLPQQPRPHMPFNHSGHPPMAPNLAYEHSRPPPLHHSQPVYHMGNKPTAVQGQQPYLQQPQTQSPYQPAGSHVGPEFGIPGSSAPPPVFPSHMVPGTQHTQTPVLSHDVETALLQQVMNLTPEQINVLPADQREPVLQLRNMLLRQ